MSTLDTTTWYRIFYTPYQTYTLVAADINASGTAAVDVLPMGSYSGYDDWQPVVMPGTAGNSVQYGFRNRALNNSLLAVFQGNPDTSVRVEIEHSTNDFPLQTQWILTPYPQQNDTFYITNAANSSDIYLSAFRVTQTQARVSMQNVGTNLTGAGTWTFVTHAPVNPSLSTSSTSSTSATSTTTGIATGTAIGSVANSATISPTSSSISSSSSQIPSNTASKHPLSTGATAGIAVGCVFAVLLLVVLGISAFRKRRRRSVPAPSALEADSSSPPTRWNEMPVSDQKAELVGEPSPVATRQGDQQRLRHEMEAANSQPHPTGR